MRRRASRNEPAAAPICGGSGILTTAGKPKTEATPGGEAISGTVQRAAQMVGIPASRRLFDTGEAAPPFSASALNGNLGYTFDSAAGRPILMLFLGSGGWAPGGQALALLARHAHLFDDERASFFGVTVDPSDAAQGRIAQRVPGIRWFLDYDLAVSRLYQAVHDAEGDATYLPYWLLLDSTMRVVAHAPIDQPDRIFAALETMIAAGPEQSHAPVLMVPRVFEPELCRELIHLYDAHGGKDSGFMRTHEGKTVAIVDHAFKRRSDYHIADAALRGILLDRFRRRLIPQMVRAFHYQPTRIERWMVGCYDAERGGFFRAHRDNTTAGTAHRVFACTVNLNAEDYDGGDLCFPEYGARTYRAPTGGAVIFSCSLLHEAMPATRGKRYAFLPFFYDEQKARLREANQVHFADGDGGYRASSTADPDDTAQKAGQEP